MSLPTPEQTKAIQAYLVRQPQARAIEIAEAIGCAEIAALAALSDEIFELSNRHWSDILTEIGHWEKVMVLVRNREAVAEITAPADSWYIKNEWLNWIDDQYNLHINIAATTQIVGLIRTGRHGPTHSFNLVNQAGQVFCRFYTRTPAAVQRFLAFCR